MRFKQQLIAAAAAALSLTAAIPVLASSHREAPFIAGQPKVDGTDFYMFRSYEPNRSEFVTLIANYQPLQDAYGGPNYFTMDPSALYEIHIDNDGNGQEDLTFQFRFKTLLKGLAVPTGPNAGNVAVPLSNIGGISAGDMSAQNVVETYTVDLVRGDRRAQAGSRAHITSGGATDLGKPFDYIGQKSLGNPAAYASYANNFIHDISIPGCTAPQGKSARVFVGQRKEGFVVNLGETFDLVNIAAPAEELVDANAPDKRNTELNTIGDKNVTSIALEIPASCLTRTGSSDPVIGAWTTASLRQSRVINPSPSAAKGAALQGGAWAQVSRLGSPLVNELVIGLPDKDKFNASKPKDDAANFAPYVLTPTLPKLLEVLFGAAGVREPKVTRTDLVGAFLTGLSGLNMPAGSPVLAEMLRLNTTTAITAVNAQNDLGVIGGDNAGFPNGRRPIDDVVDIELRVAMGLLLPVQADPAVEGSRKLHYTDGARPNPADYLATFPYLNTPIPGSPAN